MTTRYTESERLEFEQQLSRYFDGELSEAEAIRVEERLLTDPDAQQMMEQLTRTQALLQESYASEVAQVDFGAMWQGIEAGIAQKAPVTQPARPVRHEVQPGLLERFVEWLRGFGQQPLGYGLAMAAVGGLVLGISYLTVPSDVQQVAFNQPPPIAPAGAGDIDPAFGNIPPVPDQDLQASASSAQDDGLAVVQDETDVITEGVEVTDLSGDESNSLMILSSEEQVTIIWVTENDGQEISI